MPSPRKPTTDKRQAATAHRQIAIARAVTVEQELKRGRVPGLWRALGFDPDTALFRERMNLAFGLPIVAGAVWMLLAYLGVV